MLKSWLIITAASFFLELYGVNWEAVDERISTEYPQVRMLGVDQLRVRLQQPAADYPLLVDVREPQEYRVSHLPQAYNLTSAEAIAAQLPDRDAEIVVYCSVGYRSAAVARDLADLGYSNVRNLRHSIFAWANQGLPLVNAAGETDKVHPYNRIWGSLLNKSRHQYQP